MSRRAAAELTLAIIVFALALALRIDGIDRHFWLLGDQIRDWNLALGRFRDLPLVGPATHVGGYTIGPAFYWILWAIRVLVGPWFDNLPHAGGIGQATLQSAADALLLIAVWRFTSSVWIALATVILLATAAYDLALSALVWNPMMGAALAKTATALVLLGWPQRSLTGVVVTSAIAWSAVHCYTGAIFTALSVFAAIAVGWLVRGDRAGALRSVAAIAVVVATLQIPIVIHQRSAPLEAPAMGAVTGSLGRIISGEARPDLARSWSGFSAAFTFIQGEPSLGTWLIWLLIACAIAVVVKYRRDPVLLAVTVLPPLLALAGYALYVGDFLDRYYYFSLMPASVLALVLGLTAFPPPQIARAVAIVLVLVGLALTPGRVQFAATLHRMPEYGILVDGSRRLVDRRFPVRAIRTEFKLPHTADPEFIYRVLGGRIEPSSHLSATITREGQVLYQIEPGQ